MLLMIFSACLPPRPHLTFCVVDSSISGCHCSDGKIKTELSLSECDKYVALSPRDSELEMNYILDLEKSLVQCEGK